VLLHSKYSPWKLLALVTLTPLVLSIFLLY
jgi:hypothetical protein